MKDENAILAAGGTAAGFPRLRRQYGFHGKPLFGVQESGGEPTPTPPGGEHGAAAGLCDHRVLQPDPPAFPISIRRSSSAASRRACGAWRITTTGPTSMQRSILLDSGADLISLRHGGAVDGGDRRAVLDSRPSDVAGALPLSAARFTGREMPPEAPDTIRLPGFDEMPASKRAYAESFHTAVPQHGSGHGEKCSIEPYGGRHFVVQNPPQMPLTTQEMDDGLCAALYARPAHPDVRGGGRHPGASTEVKFQPDQQPGLLWRLQLLRTDLPSGADRADPQPRLHAGGGAEQMTRSRTSRAISTTWAAPPPTSASPPAKSS